jgi:hypothetical protein
VTAALIGLHGIGLTVLGVVDPRQVPDDTGDEAPGQ